MGLFITPEYPDIHAQDFKRFRGDINMMAIDEAHEVVDAGFFRYKYRKLASIILDIKGDSHIPILLTSATIPTADRNFFMSQFKMQNPFTHFWAVDREDLSLQFHQKKNFENNLGFLVHPISHGGRKAIVYAGKTNMTRRQLQSG